VQRILVDAGPIVALLNRRDHWHARSAAFFDGFSGVALTTWTVLAEAWHLLPGHKRAPLLRWLEDGGVRIEHVPETELPRVRKLVTRYRDRPMDLADATLVWLAEREDLLDIVTVDRGFAAYRTASGARFTNHLEQE
jgi:predicted nucleic acid-binding protein